MKVNNLTIQQKGLESFLKFKVGQILPISEYKFLEEDLTVNYININTKTGFIEIKGTKDNFIWYSLRDIESLSFDMSK